MNENILICRICLKTVYDDFQIVTETLRDVMDKLLLKLKSLHDLHPGQYIESVKECKLAHVQAERHMLLVLKRQCVRDRHACPLHSCWSQLLTTNIGHSINNLNISRNAVICTECVQKIQVSINFKLICVNTRDLMLPSDPHNEVNLNLYTIESAFGLSKEHEICFFCKNPTAEGCLLSLNESKENIFLLELIQKHMPELNLISISQLVACRICLESLQSLLNLLTNCLYIEETIKKYIEIHGTDENGQLELYFVQQFTFKPASKFDADYTTTNPTEVEYAQKEQDTTTKVQTEIKSLDVDGLELRIEYANPDVNSDRNDYESLQTSLFLSEYPSPLLFKCEMCTFTSECLRKLQKHMMTHDNVTEAPVYKCAECSYQNEDKENLIEHMAVHATLQCESCSFSTKYKDSLDRHELTHTDQSELETFICDKCFFQTNVKKDLRRHMIVHRNLSETTMYKCDICPFQTRHKSNLNSHNMRSHKDASEITMYECESCSFTTKYKRNMERHRATHKAPKLDYTFKITIYKCEFCSYETRHKHYLKTHMLKHKLPSELTVHQCNVCSYKTTRGKERLRQHMIVHKDASEMVAYRCESCPFTSKYKNSYERHTLTHKKPSETPMYRCIEFDTCSFQTKHKNNLKAHNMRFHRDAFDSIVNGH